MSRPGAALVAEVRQRRINLPNAVAVREILMNEKLW